MIDLGRGLIWPAPHGLRVCGNCDGAGCDECQHSKRVRPIRSGWTVANTGVHPGVTDLLEDRDVA